MIRSGSNHLSGRLFHQYAVPLAQVYTIEFQKRGLPHAHMLIILADECKPREPSDYDRIVCAEIPDTTLDSIIHRGLHRIVKRCMIHHRRSTRSGWSGHGRTTFSLALYNAYGACQFGRTSSILPISLAGPPFSPLRRPCTWSSGVA